MILEFERDDLRDEPTERSLNINRRIVVFNIKQSGKTAALNTGDVVIYENGTYEIMNREKIYSPDNYVKFNCLRKGAPSSRRKS